MNPRVPEINKPLVGDLLKAPIILLFNTFHDNNGIKRTDREFMTPVDINYLHTRC